MPSPVRAIPQPHTADVFAILGIGCWVVAAVIGSCVVFGYSDLVSSDYRIGEWFDSIGLGNAVLVKAATVWHYAGGPGGSFVLALVATVWLFIANRRGWALYVVVCGIGGLVISEVLKRRSIVLVPSWPDPAIVESGGSFPSGHSMAGIYVWAVVGIVLMYLLRRPLGTVIGWCLIVFGILMAPSRLILESIGQVTWLAAGCSPWAGFCSSVRVQSSSLQDEIRKAGPYRMKTKL